MPRWSERAGGALFAFQARRYIGSMSAKPTFVITVLGNVGGRLGRHELLRTKNEDEAVELYNMLKSDPEARVIYDVLPAGKVE